jgi:uncharacterized SAM-binding protein YcdF (DUF218 family)
MKRAWLFLPAAGLLAWGSGFAWFVQQAWQPGWEQRSPPPRADGIVVLTGGAERVAVGLKLLEQGASSRLLVSGVGAQASFRDLAHLAGVDAALAPQVTLGRAAASTHANAAETADWAHAHSVRSLIVVTAAYHMPRALEEMRASLPEVTLIAAPVQPPGMRSMRDARAWRRLLGEYTKFLAAGAGVSEWGWR